MIRQSSQKPFANLNFNLIQFFILCEQHFFYMPESIQSILLIISNLQAITYLHEAEKNEKDNFQSFVYVITYCIRPYILMDTSELMNLATFVYSFVLFTFGSSLILCFLLTFKINSEKVTLFELMAKSNIYLNFFYLFIALEK